MFLTGGEGFLGRHVAQRFAAEGCRVVSLGLGALTDRERSQFGFHALVRGLVDGALLRRAADEFGAPDIIVHAAGASSVGEAAADPAASFLLTVTSTHDVIEFARRLPRKPPIVFISSAAVYGDYGDSAIPVGVPCAPISAYGLHKSAAERLLLDAAHAYGLDVRIVRFFSLYGPHLRKQLLWDALQRVDRGEWPLRIDATGRELRDFLFVSDAADLIRRLATAASGPVVVNGGRGEPIALAALLTKLLAAAGYEPRVEFSGIDRPGNPRSLVADVKCLDGLAFRPAVALDEGLSRYARWARSELEGRRGEPGSRAAV